MTLQASGAISISNINVELGLSATATNSLNAAAFRTLAGIASGGISMSNFYGKTQRKSLFVIYSTSAVNVSLTLSLISGYIAGYSDITVTVNSGIYLWASTTGNYGLTFSGGTAGDTLKLVNNGYIIGRGGAASSAAGGPALNLSYPVTITNNGYIAGGGGGGWTTGQPGGGGGGGGAGGGNGATGVNSGGAGGAGGAIGVAGANGTTKGSGLAGAGGGSGGGAGTTFVFGGGGGGGGGRILPGTGGAGGGGPKPGGGGGSGGGAGASGGTYSGGGGGWGAAGGAGGAGGKAISLNGKTVAYITVGTVWGTVS
jgi:hypothetical protein